VAGPSNGPGGHETRVISCPNCGKKNRVRAAAPAPPHCGNCGRVLPWLADTGLAEFEAVVEKSPVPVVVDFWAPWCGPCRMVSPALERLASEQAGKLKLVKVNTDEEEALGSRFGIRGIPTMILFEGGRERDRVTGALPLNDLRRWLEERLTTQGTRSKG
jgi:thioredoxin 2